MIYPMTAFLWPRDQKNAILNGGLSADPDLAITASDKRAGLSG